MFPLGFNDVQTPQSIRFQKTEIPTLKYLLVTQLSRYLEQRFMCYRDRQLESNSVMAILALLEDLHTLISLRDYKDSTNERNHDEEFKKLRKECVFELNRYMSKKINSENERISASQTLMEIFNKIFWLETRYLERFGLLEPEDARFEAESVDIDIENVLEEWEQELNKEQGEKNSDSPVEKAQI